MELIQLKNRTWMIPGATCIGVYIFEDETCCLIDSGFDEHAAKGAFQLLCEHHLKVETILNTHAHGDHVGGDQFIQQQTHCRIMARPQEALQIIHPEMQPCFLFGADPLPILKVPFMTPPAAEVTEVLQPGDVEIKGEMFEVLDLAGHSVQHCGIVTPDGVSFLGDALIEENVLETTPFVYSAYVEKSVHSIQSLQRRKETTYCLAHGGVLADFHRCAQKNLQIFQELLEWYLQLLQIRSRSREELIQLTINERLGKTNTLRYFMTQTTVSAYLAYLCTKKVVRCQVKEGILVFILKEDLEKALEVCRFL